MVSGFKGLCRVYMFFGQKKSTENIMEATMLR